MTRILVSIVAAACAIAMVLFVSWMGGWDFTRDRDGGWTALFAVVFGVIAAGAAAAYSHSKP